MAVEPGRAHRAVDKKAARSVGAVAAHLARMHAQREVLFEAIAGEPQERLWAGPFQGCGIPGA